MSYPSPSSGQSGGGSWPSSPHHGAPGPQPPYSQPQPPYGQPPYGQPSYGQGPYDQPQYGQPSYGQPSFGQGPYDHQPRYGQPGYGPPYDPPGYGQQPPYGQPPRTSGYAVAALLLGLVAPIGLFILPVVLALVAFRQIKLYGDRGFGLAIGGLVATGVWLLVAGAGITVAIATEDDPDPPPPTTRPPVTTQAPPATTEPPEPQNPERVEANSLRPGDCIQDLDNNDGTVSGLPVVPCAQEHEGEVYATFDIPDGSWPGQDAVTEQSRQGCSDRLSENYPEAAADDETTLYYLFPTETSWLFGDRKVICMTFYQDGPRTGSIVG